MILYFTIMIYGDAKVSIWECSKIYKPNHKYEYHQQPNKKVMIFIIARYWYKRLIGIYWYKRLIGIYWYKRLIGNNKE